MKHKRINILIISLLLLGAMAIMLILFIDKAHDDFKKEVKVRVDGVTEETLTVRGLKLNPTESREYEILLKCEASGTYDIFLDYEETNDGGMKEFVNVTVKSEERNVYEGSLTELLDENKIVEFDGTLEAKDPLVITIRYEMPYDVGNEAQGTSSDFQIHLKIRKN